MPYDPNAPRYHWLVTCRDGTRLTYADFRYAADVQASHTVNYAQYDPARMADTIVRKDIPDMLTAEELASYQPGHNCSCGATSAYGCRCRANWTSPEIYTLRNLVCDLEKQNDSLTRAVAKNHEIIDKLRDSNRSLSDELVALELAFEGLKNMLQSSDQMQDDYENYIHQMQDDVVMN